MNIQNLLDQVTTEAEPAAQQPAWSVLQLAIFEAIHGPDNLLIQAVAGSGKTTTIVEGMRYANGSSLFMAFNKAIAQDIRSRASSGDVKTLNALGHRLWMENQPAAVLNARKSMDILEKLMGKESQDFKDHGYTLSRVLGMAKNLSFMAPEPPDFVDLMDSYGFEIPFESQAQLSCIAVGAFEQSCQDLKTFDFDDQLYVPIREGWEFPRYDNLFVDECQDLSPIQHDMLDALKQQGARIVAVGDRHQAIYGFRGAAVDSMDRLKRKFGMLELPLSVSYRCPSMVIEAAREFCPHIQARPGAPEGVVKWQSDSVDDSGWADDPRLFSNALIVCRNNAPLFQAILRHVRAKSPCRVLTNFLDSFQGFIRGFKSTYTSDLRAKLDGWYQREREAAERKNARGKLFALRDRYETVKLLCADYQRTEDVIRMVKKLGEGTTGPTFATIHKAKGLEHENVYILRPDLMPAFYATTAAQRQQEANLHYVAITRAKATLTYGAGQL